jgi:hypothetical protein
MRGIRGQAVHMARQAMPVAVNATTTAAQQAVPLAKQAVPLARNASSSVRHGADDAVAWATPYVNTARSWTAPRLEHSAVALSENIAPMISSALIAAARKIDADQPKPHRISKAGVLAGSMLLTAAGAAAAISLRHRRNGDDGFTATTPMTGADQPGMPAGTVNGSYGESDPDLPDADANGHPRMT